MFVVMLISVVLCKSNTMRGLPLDDECILPSIDSPGKDISVISNNLRLYDSSASNTF